MTTGLTTKGFLIQKRGSEHQEILPVAHYHESLSKVVYRQVQAAKNPKACQSCTWQLSSREESPCLVCSLPTTSCSLVKGQGERSGQLPKTSGWAVLEADGGFTGGLLAPVRKSCRTQPSLKLATSSSETQPCHNELTHLLLLLPSEFSWEASRWGEG